MALWRKGDPGEAAAERINATGFQVQGQARGLQDQAKRPEIMVQRLTAGDHHEGGTGFGFGSECGKACSGCWGGQNPRQRHPQDDF